jgi:hypothetical protein
MSNLFTSLTPFLDPKKLPLIHNIPKNIYMCENNDQKFEQYETLCVNADKEKKPSKKNIQTTIC